MGIQGLLNDYVAKPTQDHAGKISVVTGLAAAASGFALVKFAKFSQNAQRAAWGGVAAATAVSLATGGYRTYTWYTSGSSSSGAGA